MRILHLSWEYPPIVYGGLGRHVHHLAEAQAAAGHDVVVVTQHEPDASFDEWSNGVRVLRVPMDPPHVPQSDLLAWVMAFDHAVSRAVARLSAGWRPEVVHGHDWLVAHAAATAKDLFDAPLVATVHATEAGRHQGWLPGPVNKAIHTVEWWLTYEARRVITCSSHMQWEVTMLFDLPVSKVDVVPNGIDLARWAVSRDAVDAARTRFAGSGPLIVFTGRLEWEKGAHTLVSAVPQLLSDRPGLRLVVVGQGSQREALQTLVEDLGITDAVAFTGWLPDHELPALAAAADLAVVPSIYEPFGMVALESVAVGTPLVVADTGGLRELVEHKVAGLHFVAGEVDGLVRAVRALLDDEVLGRRLVREGRAVLAEKYAWSQVARRTEAVYAQALADDRVLRDRGVRQSQAPAVVVTDGNLLADDDNRPSAAAL